MTHYTMQGISEGRQLADSSEEASFVVPCKNTFAVKQCFERLEHERRPLEDTTSRVYVEHCSACFQHVKVHDILACP